MKVFLRDIGMQTLTQQVRKNSDKEYKGKVWLEI